MTKTYDYLYLSDLIKILQREKDDKGDLCVGFRYKDFYNHKFTVETTDFGDITFDISED